MNPEDWSRLEARLADMLGVLGAEGLAAFLSLTRGNLCDLIDSPGPWSPAEAQAGIDIAMLLGLEAVESICRAVRADPATGDAAARAGLRALVAWLESREGAGASP